MTLLESWRVPGGGDRGLAFFAMAPIGNPITKTTLSYPMDKEVGSLNEMPGGVQPDYRPQKYSLKRCEFLNRRLPAHVNDRAGLPHL